MALAMFVLENISIIHNLLLTPCSFCLFARNKEQKTFSDYYLLQNDFFMLPFPLQAHSSFPT